METNLIVHYTTATGYKIYTYGELSDDLKTQILHLKFTLLRGNMYRGYFVSIDQKNYEAELRCISDTPLNTLADGFISIIELYMKNDTYTDRMHLFLKEIVHFAKY